MCGRELFSFYSWTTPTYLPLFRSRLSIAKFLFIVNRYLVEAILL